MKKYICAAAFAVTFLCSVCADDALTAHKLGSLRYRIECKIPIGGTFWDRMLQLLPWVDDCEIQKVHVNKICDQFKYETIDGKITQVKNPNTNEKVHFYVWAASLNDDIVNCDEELPVRTSPDYSHPYNIFMSIPPGAKIQRVKTQNQMNSQWVEIEFPTNDIYFVIEKKQE